MRTAFKTEEDRDTFLECARELLEPGSVSAPAPAAVNAPAPSEDTATEDPGDVQDVTMI